MRLTKVVIIVLAVVIFSGSVFLIQAANTIGERNKLVSVPSIVNSNYEWLPILLGEEAGPTVTLTPVPTGTSAPTFTITPSPTKTSTTIPTLTSTPTQTPTSTPQPIILQKDNDEIGGMICSNRTVFEVGSIFNLPQPILLDKVSFSVGCYAYNPFCNADFIGRTNVYEVNSTSPTLELSLLGTSPIGTCYDGLQSTATCTFELNEKIYVSGQILLSVRNTAEVHVGYIPCISLDSQTNIPFGESWIRIGGPDWQEHNEFFGDALHGYPVIRGEGVLIDGVTETPMPSVSPTSTLMPSPTNTATSSPTATSTPTLTVTSLPTSTSTTTPTSNSLPTSTSTATPTATSSATSTNTPTPTTTNSPTSTSTPEPTITEP